MSISCLQIKTTKEEIQTGIRFIQSTLAHYKVNKKYVVSSMLRAEESMVKLAENAADGAELLIEIKIHWNGRIEISLSCKGSEFSLSENIIATDMSKASEQKTESFIRNIVLRSFADTMEYKHAEGVNNVKILVRHLEKRNVFVFGAVLIIAIFLFLVVYLAGSSIFEIEKAISGFFVNNLNLGK